jgi:hypothetical protein
MKLVKIAYRILVYEGVTIVMAFILTFFLWLYIGLPYRQLPSWLYETKTVEFKCPVRILAKSGEFGLICTPDTVKAKIWGLATTLSKIKKENIVVWVEPDYEVLSSVDSHPAKVNVRVEGIIAFVEIDVKPERVLIKKISHKSKLKIRNQ